MTRSNHTGRCSARAIPMRAGYFGEFGGRFVPETLVAPVEELTEAYFRVRDDDELPDRARRSAAQLRRPADAALRGEAADRVRRRRAHRASSARTWRTPARTRSTTRSARRCSPCGWASGASSPRPAPGSTASRRPRCARCSGSSASSTWAPTTWRGRRSTSSGCGCSAPRWSRSTSGARTLKDAINEAMRDWVTNVTDTYYLLGSVLGPHPYPLMVREFQSVIGREARAQCIAQLGPAAGRRSSRASAAAATRWASSTPSSTTGRSA